MKVTDKKFLNVHQTIGPLTVTTTGTTSKEAASEQTKADAKLLVSQYDWDHEPVSTSKLQ